MAKKKTVTIESAEALGEGLFKIINSDGSFIMAIQISEAAIGLLAPEAEEEDEEDEEEESVSLDEMKDALIESGVTKKALKKMSDEEIEEAYNDLETEDEDEEESDDDDDEEDEDSEDSEESDDDDEEDDGDSDEDEDEDDEEEVTPEALSEMDYEELEDLCDDKELDTDPDDFEEDQIEKFRSAVAKELGIKLPKAKKGKK